MTQDDMIDPNVFAERVIRKGILFAKESALWPVKLNCVDLKQGSGY